MGTQLSINSLPTNSNLSEKLQWTRKFGKARLSFHGDGWYAVIEMNTSSTGSEFNVKSDFRHATPDAAVSQVIERMVAALRALGVTQ